MENEEHISNIIKTHLEATLNDLGEFYLGVCGVIEKRYVLYLWGNQLSW
ncbi:Uncharacterised protein [Serratia fonticola]|uniref:Uncharacterized protein n=1 Tax=Serratia fonticola TaxID=47917 RepID=A0A4U9TVP0_SERFO|nr:Uncharacterised protein [Serratia fonticola]